MWEVDVLVVKVVVALAVAVTWKQTSLLILFSENHLFSEKGNCQSRLEA